MRSTWLGRRRRIFRSPQTRWVRAGALGLTAPALAVALVLAGAGGGYPAGHPRLRSGAAWLASVSVGQLTLLDGSSAEVAAQVQVATRGDQVDVVQQGANAYAVNRTTGTVRRVDGATFQATAPAMPLPDARGGLAAFAGTDALYALDTQRGVLVTADPRTLVDTGPPVPLAPQASAQSVTMDDAGRLWVLDTGTGDLVWIDHGQRHTRRGLAAAGTGLLTLAGGSPVVVDTGRRVAQVLDPRDGAIRNSVALDLRAGDRIQVGGSPNDPRIYLVADRGVLDVCNLDHSGCDSAVPLASAGGSDLGVPVETGGRLFVPDYGSGKVWIVDLDRSRVVAQPKILDPRTHFQLLTRDGVVFYNDPGSERAGVLRLDGGFTARAKYDVANPDKGLSGQPVASPTPTGPDGAPLPAPQPPPATPGAAGATPPDLPPFSVRISVSTPTVYAGADVTLKVAAVVDPQPVAARWTFGDGQTGTGTRPSHQWSAAQTYQVSVQATFADGRTATASLPIPVIARRPKLTLSVPATGGTVTGTGLSCPPTCSTTTAPGQSVTLTANAATGFSFAGWRGGCVGTNKTCTVVMTADTTVTAAFTAGTTPPPSLGAPVPTSPADGQLFTNYPRNTTLTWLPVTGAAKYLVEVDCDTCGASPWTVWISTTVTTTSYSFVWVGDNTGRWRVTAIGPDGTQGPPSGYRTFRFKTPPAQLPAPVLTSPADGTVFNNFPRTTTLTWLGVSGAVKYHVEVDCDICSPTMWAPWKTADVTGTSFTFDFVGAQSGRWRVTAVDANGTSGVPSGYRTFRYTR